MAKGQIKETRNHVTVYTDLDQSAADFGYLLVTHVGLTTFVQVGYHFRELLGVQRSRLVRIVRIK